LDAAIARGELVGGQRRVGGAEVDLAVGDRLDPAARADGRVLHGVVERRAERGRPDRDERRHERAASSVQSGRARLRTRTGGCEEGVDRNYKEGDPLLSHLMTPSQGWWLPPPGCRSPPATRTNER